MNESISHGSAVNAGSVLSFALFILVISAWLWSARGILGHGLEFVGIDTSWMDTVEAWAERPSEWGKSLPGGEEALDLLDQATGAGSGDAEPAPAGDEDAANAEPMYCYIGGVHQVCPWELQSEEP